MKNSKKISIIALMTAISVILMFIEIPIIPAYGFLKYDLSDVIPLITGLYGGAAYGILIILIRNTIHFLFKGDMLGDLMGLCASISFVLPPIFIYRKIHTKLGGILGILSGVICLNISMYLLNYIIVPIFYGMKGKVLYDYLLYGVIPFNFLKGFLNTIVVIFLYKRFSGIFLKNMKK